LKLVKLRVLYVNSMPGSDWQLARDGVDTDTPSHLVWSESLRGACEALRRPWSARKIGAACNALAEKAIERSAEARSALRNSETRRAEPTWHRISCWGPQGRRSSPEGPRRTFGCG